ncbi:MAG: hypothetical protein GY705_04235 [Bacteroidetes bacterium]|nr:hypothetical protein [Bacteroidota bacterium]
MLSTRLWFTELAAGAAGPGVRIQGGVRGDDYDLHLSDNMHGTLETLSAFTENGSSSPIFNFADFNSRFIGFDATVSNTAVNVIGCTNGTKGLIYLNKDRNSTSDASITGAQLTVKNIYPDYTKYKFEFWSTSPNQASPLHIRTASSSSSTLAVSIPDFDQDWAVRFYPYGSGTSDNWQINTSSVIGKGTTVTFSSNAIDLNNSQMYYRFDLIPNYGAANYDPTSNFSIIQDFSTSNSASYTFNETGDYIVVVWASPTNGFSSGYQQIMGGSVSIFENAAASTNCIQLTGLDFSSGRETKVGSLVTISADCVNTCSGTTYFRFDLIPNYGSDDYDPSNNYSILQDFSTKSSCAYTFSKSGSYIVVVWASQTPGIPSGAAPIFGGSINVSD